MLLPIVAILPFFVSAILALGALVASNTLRSLLTAYSLWLMLWAFLSIPFAIWKLTIIQRRKIQTAI
jgi:hypothetical protein